MSELDNQLNQARAAEAAGNFFSAAFLYKDALSLARNAGQSAIIKICKNKIPEMNKQVKNDLNKFSIECKVSEESINKVIKHFLDKGDAASILKAIGIEPVLFPKYQEIVKSAQTTMPIGFNIANLSTISDEDHLIKGGDDGMKFCEMTLYERSQTIILRAYLTGLFYEIAEKNIINKKVFSDYLKNTGFFTNWPFEIIEIGIERYFTGDFVSALHILIPQFEGLFLYLSGKLSLDVVALNRGQGISTQTTTLSLVFLSTEECKKVWGEDLCEQLKFILFEPLGYELRHKMAHGRIRVSECNFGTVSLVLYLYLVLSARVKTIKFNNVIK